MLIAKPLAFIAAMFLALLLIAKPGHAMGMCGKRADFIKALNDKYSETGKALGIAGQVNLVEFFTSKAGTWTILVTDTQGRACIIAAGNSWQDVPPEILGEDS